MVRAFRLIVAVLIVASGPAAAETPRTVSWDDLVPKNIPAPDNPVERLTEAQRDDLAFVLRARDVQAQTGLDDGSGLATEAAERAKKLRQAGIDINRLIAELRKAEAAWRAYDETLASELDGQLVRMPGYVLPLEFAGSKVTEFLLVPFVGACIHVPPPPPNQIVLVKYEAGFADSGIFTPVYVTGRMSAKGTARKTLFLTDGNANVAFGYTLDGSKVEIHRE